MSTDILLGLQWGDEGKGKVVDLLTKDYDIIARFQGGPNAGHSLEFDGNKHVLHTIPSGIFHEKSINMIGNGVVIDPVILKKEIQDLKPFKLDIPKRLVISRKAHLILPTHRWLDLLSETLKGKSKIGSTLKGIAPAYMDKTGRNGFRVGDLEMPYWKARYKALRDKHLNIIASHNIEVDFDLESSEKDFFEALKWVLKIPFTDENYILKAQKEGKHILAEGAQGSLLDIDFGTYPYVTSSTTISAGACIGLGIPPNSIRDVIGVFKAYTTRVGSGPFPTELFNETGAYLAKIGHEFGATTGRPRRCGWLDLVALKYAVQINGVTKLVMTKGDVLSGLETLKICTSYNYKGEIIGHLPYNIEKEHVSPIYTSLKGWSADLTKIKAKSEFPKELNQYIDFLEKQLEVSIKIISVGPNRTQTIYRK